MRPGELALQPSSLTLHARVGTRSWGTGAIEKRTGGCSDDGSAHDRLDRQR
jgi:hypothetical protein